MHEAQIFNTKVTRYNVDIQQSLGHWAHLVILTTMPLA
jgi:hypothetical protein